MTFEKISGIFLNLFHNRYKLEDARLSRDKERRKAAQSQKKADRQERVDEIRKKYGLYQHEPTYKKLQEIE